jgi:hypothetical protein
MATCGLVSIFILVLFMKLSMSKISFADIILVKCMGTTFGVADLLAVLTIGICALVNTSFISSVILVTSSPLLVVIAVAYFVDFFRLCHS